MVCISVSIIILCVGIHPDNIDKTNKKVHDGWLVKVEECAKESECVAVLTGLSLEREIGSHFAQVT